MDALVGKTFYFDPLIPEAERRRQIEKIRTAKGLVTERMNSADVIILADVSNKDDLEGNMRKRVRDARWISRTLELHAAGDFEPSSLVQPSRASTNSINVATPPLEAAQKRKRRTSSSSESDTAQPSKLIRFANEGARRTYTREELEKLSKYIADHPTMPIDNAFWKKLRQDCPWARTHSVGGWRTMWFRHAEGYRRKSKSAATSKQSKHVQHPKLTFGVTAVKAGPSKRSRATQDSVEGKENQDKLPLNESLSNTADNDESFDQGDGLDWPAAPVGFKPAGPLFAPEVNIRLGGWRRRAVTLVKNSDPSQSSGSAPTQPSTAHAPITALTPSISRSADNSQPSLLANMPSKAGSLLGGAEGGEDIAVSQPPVLVHPGPEDEDGSNEEDPDYVPDNASFDAEDYVRQSQTTLPTQSHLHPSDGLPLSGEVLEEGAKRLPEPVAPPRPESGANHINAYFERSLQEQSGIGLTQLFLSQAPDQDLHAAVKGSHEDPDGRMRLISATISFIAHWLQRDVDEVWQHWQTTPLPRQNFADLQKWCLTSDKTRPVRRHGSRSSITDASCDETGTTTSNSRVLLAPMNAKRRYPYPPKPDREWAKHICRMLAALYDCRLPSKVYDIWVAAEGDARATEEILRQERGETAPLDVHKMGVGDIPRPWL